MKSGLDSTAWCSSSERAQLCESSRHLLVEGSKLKRDRSTDASKRGVNHTALYLALLPVPGNTHLHAVPLEDAAQREAA